MLHSKFPSQSAIIVNLFNTSEMSSNCGRVSIDFSFSFDRESLPNRPHDACRLHGTLQLTKVAGNFHVTAGKVLPLPMRAHAHIAPPLQDDRFNYSHRINQFSFGQTVAGLVQPLEGDEIVTQQGKNIKFK